jgi:hypothetical protein
MDACYYSLIRRTREGEFVGWVPDLHGVTAAGRSEDHVYRCPLLVLTDTVR